MGVIKALRVAFIAVALIAPACSPSGQNVLQGPTSLIVTPDHGARELLQLLRRAETSIDLMVYLLSSAEIIEELAAARQRGVQVRVLLEENPVGGGEYNRLASQRLAAAGVRVRWTSPAFRFTHAKVIIVDAARAAIMTLNLTASSFRSNREFALIVEDPAVVNSLHVLFQSDWEHVPSPEFGLPLVISPGNARSIVHDLIASAHQSLEVYVLSLEDDAIAEALADAARRGVRVRLITNPPSERDPYADERASLRENGGIIGFLAYPDVHAKVIVVDGQRAFVGSQNLTATSLDQNREVGIVTDDPSVLRQLRQTFAADWSQVALEQSAAFLRNDAA